MGYILGLLLILAIIFSAVTGNNLFGNLWYYVKDKADTFLFPKTEKEILIENLNAKYDILDRFFSQSAPKILGSQNISKEDKKTVQEAAKVFNETKEIIKNLGNLQKEDRSLTKAIIQKAFDLMPKKEEALPDPTHIPPQCRLECSN